MRYHEDARAKRFCDIFDGTIGDVNLFVLQPGQTSAWHRHKQQVDQFLVLYGDVRFGCFADGFAPHYKVVNGTQQGNPLNRVTMIPGMWHGYENLGNEQAWILMYLSHKYEDGWDEERRTLEEMPWNP